MEEKEIKLKPKKQNFIGKINNLFKDKKKRGLYVLLFILPFLIAIGIFGVVVYKEAKTLLDLAKGEVEVEDENVISSMNYVLRNDATDVQKEYFAELKQAVEVDNASDEVLAGLVCKNYIADLYTWTNKQGQYDISSLYYVYTPQKETIYVQARDELYKYINYYINKYNSENLIEVDNVVVNSSTKLGYDYVASDEEAFNKAMYVSCSWSYKPETKMNVTEFATSMNFIVVERAGRYEIVEASENKIDAKVVEEEKVEEQSQD